MSFIHSFIHLFIFYFLIKIKIKLGTSTERRKQRSPLVLVTDKGHKTDEAKRVYSDTQTTVRKPNCMNFCCDHPWEAALCYCGWPVPLGSLQTLLAACISLLTTEDLNT